MTLEPSPVFKLVAQVVVLTSALSLGTMFLWIFCLKQLALI